MGHVIWSGITWLRAGAGRLGEDIRGCWLSSLPFPFLTALFTLIAGIMVHPRPVLSHWDWVCGGGRDTQVSDWAAGLRFGARLLHATGLQPGEHVPGFLTFLCHWSGSLGKR